MLSLALNSASRDGILVPSYLEGSPLLWKMKSSFQRRTFPVSAKVLLHGSQEIFSDLSFRNMAFSHPYNNPT